MRTITLSQTDFETIFRNADLGDDDTARVLWDKAVELDDDRRAEAEYAAEERARIAHDLEFPRHEWICEDYAQGSDFALTSATPQEPAKNRRESDKPKAPAPLSRPLF